MNCTRCESTGWLNLHQLGADVLSKFEQARDHEAVEAWLDEHKNSDVQVCDCCGDGAGWHGTPGEHYGADDPSGMHGPYACNGGLCKCH